MTDSRSAMLAAIAQRRGRANAAEVIHRQLEELGAPPCPGLDADTALETFLMRLIQAKASAEVAADRSQVVKAISNYLYKRHNSRRLVSGHDPRLAALPWRDGGVLVRFDAAVPEDVVSVSYARLAVAESGSVLLYSDRSNPARNNWLVQEHIVVLDLDELQPSLEDAWQLIARDREAGICPRGIHFISGPSSTGDIVGHIVVGAHGPQKLHVIIRGHVDSEQLDSLAPYLQPII